MSLIRRDIRIELNAISCLSPFSGKAVYTIWRDDFDSFREAFKRCEEYAKEQEALERKHMIMMEIKEKERQEVKE